MSGIDTLFSWADEPVSGSSEGSIRVNIDAHHPIFHGHFPERPVVPGVCLVHLATRIASKMSGGPLRLLNARSIKFLAPVDPKTTPQMTFTTKLITTDAVIKADVQAHAGDVVVMKLTAELVPEVR